MTGEGNKFKAYVRAHLRLFFAALAVLIGLAYGTTALFFNLRDANAVEGLPVESATILTIQAAGSSGCGRSDYPRDVEVRSHNPPEGLPASFWLRDKCIDASDDVGESVQVVREVHEDGSVRTWYDPSVGRGDAFKDAGLNALAWFLLAAVTYTVMGLLYRMWLKFFPPIE